MSTRRRLDIGVSSYQNPAKLRATLESIERATVSDWRCFIVHNESDSAEGREALQIARHACDGNQRFTCCAQPNTFYAGAVNRIFERTKTPYIAYLDNDVEILTPGWDEKLCAILDFREDVGQVFPGEGHYGFQNAEGFHECLWNAGYAWIVRRAAAMGLMTGYRVDHFGLLQSPEVEAFRASGPMDKALGHHEEVDLMIRLRMAGYRIACDPAVSILHHASATNSPAAQERIHAGVVRFMNKWNRYFVGDGLKYPDPDQPFDPATGRFASGEGYDPRMLRYTDWPPCALYLERWTLAQFPQWNAAPTVQSTSAGPMDIIGILKPSGCYKGRAI